MAQPDTPLSTAHIDVHYVANLARLQLKPDEAARFQQQLERIIVYFNQIRSLNVDGVEPMFHTAKVHNVFREDVVHPGLNHDVVMANAPARADGQFTVPKIVE